MFGWQSENTMYFMRETCESEAMLPSTLLEALREVVRLWKSSITSVTP